MLIKFTLKLKIKITNTNFTRLLNQYTVIPLRKLVKPKQQHAKYGNQ